MKYLLIDSNHVIVYITDSAIQTDTGIVVDDGNLTFGGNELDVIQVDNVPVGAVQQKYCYTAAEGFYLNPNYRPTEETNIDIQQLRSDVDTLLVAQLTAEGIL